MPLDNEATRKLHVILKASGLPFKACEAYGSQVVVTCWSEAAARRMARMLGKAFKLRGVVRDIDYNEDQTRRATLRPASHEVWRVFARVCLEAP